MGCLSAFFSFFFSVNCMSRGFLFLGRFLQFLGSMIMLVQCTTYTTLGAHHTGHGSNLKLAVDFERSVRHYELTLADPRPDDVEVAGARPQLYFTTLEERAFVVGYLDVGDCPLPGDQRRADRYQHGFGPRHA